MEVVHTSLALHRPFVITCQTFGTEGQPRALDWGPSQAWGQPADPEAAQARHLGIGRALPDQGVHRDGAQAVMSVDPVVTREWRQHDRRQRVRDGAGLVLLAFVVGLVLALLFV